MGDIGSLVADAVERIKPILAGRPPEVQGAILADLLAIWLADHQVEGDANGTRLVFETTPAKRADLMLDRGDDEGRLVWARIRRAIEALRAPAGGNLN